MLHVGPSNNSLYVMVCNGSNSYGYTGANVVSPGTWYHVAAVFDGTQTGDSNRLKLYLNGVQQSLTFPLSIPASTSSTNTAYIGINHCPTYNFSDLVQRFQAAEEAAFKNIYLLYHKRALFKTSWLLQYDHAQHGILDAAGLDLPTSN